MKREKQLQVVWLKRDLRTLDHAPIAEAIDSGKPTLLLFVFETILKDHPDFDWRHWQFCYASLMEMNEKLKTRSAEVMICFGDALDILKYLDQNHGIDKLYSHQETGVQVTFDRDLAVKRWCKEAEIPWDEALQFGVFRGMQNRKKWDENWKTLMSSPVQNPNWDAFDTVDVENPAPLPKRISKKMSAYPEQMQPAGELMAQKYLRSFLQGRGKNYMRFISKPTESRSHCSRISPYLSWGCISMRSVYQSVLSVWKTFPNKRSLIQFTSRLHWHCHFIQKFEMEHAMEFRNVNRGFDKIRTEANPQWVKAWMDGKTGVPLVDACMRCVVETGYLNFRMRAMLASFHSHVLWQDWGEGIHHLARQFLDYEPGIHYPQFQMQSSVTGVNSIRVYNPYKQAEDHDPEALFIKKWLPELRALPTALALRPDKMTAMDQSMYGVHLGKDYPFPLVDVHKCAEHARKQLWAMKKDVEVREESERILKKHVRRTPGDKERRLG